MVRSDVTPTTCASDHKKMRKEARALLFEYNNREVRQRFLNESHLKSRRQICIIIDTPRFHQLRHQNIVGTTQFH